MDNKEIEKYNEMLSSFSLTISDRKDGCVNVYGSGQLIGLLGGSDKVSMTVEKQGDRHLLYLFANPSGYVIQHKTINTWGVTVGRDVAKVLRMYRGHSYTKVGRSNSYKGFPITVYYIDLDDIPANNVKEKQETGAVATKADMIYELVLENNKMLKELWNELHSSN